MHSFQWKSISWKKIPTFALPKITIKKTPNKHKWKASHATLVLQILPCIYVRISSLARALLCRNKRLAFHTSQEANVHDACLSSVSQRKLTCQEDEIVYPCILWRTTVKMKTQTSANEATSGAAAGDRLSSTGGVSTSAQSCTGCETPRVKCMRWVELLKILCKMHTVIMAKSPHKVTFQFSVLPTLNQTCALKAALNSLLYITSNEKECLTLRIAIATRLSPGSGFFCSSILIIACLLVVWLYGAKNM